jgi:hypothetical protein
MQCLARSTFDEDIPTKLLPPSLQDKDDVAVKVKSNEVRIEPITRARAKLLKQHVNSLLNDTFTNENFILPKSFHLCMIRYEDGANVARGREEQLDMVLDMKTNYYLLLNVWFSFIPYLIIWYCI